MDNSLQSFDGEATASSSICEGLHGDRPGAHSIVDQVLDDRLRACGTVTKTSRERRVEHTYRENVLCFLLRRSWLIRRAAVVRSTTTPMLSPQLMVSWAVAPFPVSGAIRAIGRRGYGVPFVLCSPRRLAR